MDNVDGGMDHYFFVSLYVGGTLALCGVLWIFVRKTVFGASSSLNSQTAANNGKENEKANKKKAPQVVEKKAVKKHRTISEDQSVVPFSHPWLSTTLKGHSAPVSNLQISSNGKLLASCAPDRTVLIWLTKDFSNKDHKQIRVNVEFDSANLIFWSPDNKAFIISKAEHEEIEVFKMGKKPDGSLGNIQMAIKYPKVHSKTIIGLGIACNGTYVMSCSADGKMVIWDLKGSVLKEINVDVGRALCAKISPCGRYVVVGGDKPVANRYGVTKSEHNKSVEVAPLEALKGNDGGVCSLDFKIDSSMVVTLTKTGVWRLFDIRRTPVTVPTIGKLDPNLLNDLEVHPFVKLSKDSLVFVGVKRDVKIFSSFSGDLLFSLEGVHEGCIRDVSFTVDDKFFITCGDKAIRVFSNIAGMKEKVRFARESLKSDKNVTEALKVRLEEEIVRIEAQLKSMTA